MSHQISSAKMLFESIELVNKFFKSDIKKLQLWFDTQNPNFGDVSPMWLIQNGRLHKVHQFIMDSIEGNSP